jgi:regulator of PEP synthase PpsR (kinase-PPPase family)
METENKKYHIFALSDSKGVTVEMVVKVALAQFTDKEVEFHLRTEVKSLEKIDEAIREAKEYNGMIIHSFVMHEFADYIWYEGRLHNIEVVNLLGSLLNRFSNFLHTSPAERPGMFTQLNKEYFRRIATTEFALRHDDGAHVDELMNAELVLLGVSRTFKTPLCVYLAYKGWMVANIPIVVDIPLPDIVYKLPPERVICLVTNPTALSRLRDARNEYLKGLVPKYAAYDNVKQELRYANHLFSTQPKWATVKVTAKPIEEIANNIIRIFRKKQREYAEKAKS